jgi:hypothetical protein
MELDRIQEIQSPERWRAASIGRRFAALQALVRLLGADWQVVRGTAQPRSHDLLSTREGHGVRLVHRPTRIAWQIVPAQRLTVGFTDAERAAMAGVLGDAGLSPDDIAWCIPKVTSHEAEVGAFLIAERPLAIGELRTLIAGGEVAVLPRPHDGRAAFFKPHEAAEAVSSSPFDLPTDAEWEAAYRAGSASPFPWGLDVPATLDAIPPHPFGLVDPALLPEGTLTGGDYGVRGGAIIHHPWTVADGGWSGLLAGLRAPWGDDAIAALRPVFRLGG